MARQRTWISILGVIIIGLSLSYIHYLFPLPFRPQPGIQRLAKEGSQFPEVIKERLGIGGLSREEVENKLTKDFRFSWVISALLIALGISAGITIFRRKNYGRVCAIGVSLFLVLFKIWIILRSYPHIGERLKLLYVILLKEQPLLVIRNDILTTVVCIITVIYLTRRSVESEFQRK